MASAVSQVLVISDEVYKYMVFGDVESAEEDDGAPADPAIEAAEAFGRTVDVAEEQIGRRPLPPRGHVHFSALRGMSDRTISISSAGKTFSVTGWQVLWIAAGALCYAFRAKAGGSAHLTLFEGDFNLRGFLLGMVRCYVTSLVARSAKAQVVHAPPPLILRRELALDLRSFTLFACDWQAVDAGL